MNRYKTPGPFSALKSAKLVLCNLMLLSSATLFAPAASAVSAMSTGYDNYTECLDINTNISRYISTYGYSNAHDYIDFNNEWTLSGSLQTHIPYYPNLPKDINGSTKLKLVGIKVTTKPYDLKVGGKDNVAFPVIKAVSCEFKDPTGAIAGSLYLELKESGRISIGSENKIAEKDMDGNPITDRTLSYISRSGQLLGKTKWNYDKNATTVTEFTCSDKDTTNWTTRCGGFNMLRKIQNNGFWSDAFNKCRRDWPRCNFEEMPFVYWSYAIDLRAKHHRKVIGPSYCSNPLALVDGWPKTGATNCRLLDTNKAYCVEAKCETEIAAINNIIGEYKDGSGKSGMADYLTAKHVCWGPLGKKVAWKGKKWDKRFETCTDMSQPTEDWPDYSHLSSSYFYVTEQ